MEGRIREYQRCGSTVRVRQCKCCLTERCGSGDFVGCRTCKTKACHVCAKTRAIQVERFFERAFDVMPEMEGYSWRLIVLTTKYDPSDPNDLTWQALRERVEICNEAAKRLWEKLLRSPGSGMMRHTESGKHGHVHLNLIYYGPLVLKEEIEAVAQKTHPRIGHADVQTIDHARRWTGKGYIEDQADDCRGSKEGLKRAVKYVAKGLHTDGIWNENFDREEQWAMMVDPRLAVRWELATYRMHLTQRYGVLRGLDLDEEGEDLTLSTDDDRETPCDNCGVVGEWNNCFRTTSRWVDECHEQGRAAFTRSEWKPPPFDADG